MARKQARVAAMQLIYEQMEGGDGGEETLTFKTGNGGEIRDFFRARYDLLNQIEEDEIRLEEWRDGAIMHMAGENEVKGGETLLNGWLV